MRRRDADSTFFLGEGWFFRRSDRHSIGPITHQPEASLKNTKQNLHYLALYLLLEEDVFFLSAKTFVKRHLFLPGSRSPPRAYRTQDTVGDILSSEVMVDMRENHIIFLIKAVED